MTLVKIFKKGNITMNKVKFKNALLLPRNGNYFNFRDKHVIIGWRDYDEELLYSLLTVSGGTKSRIHIFISDISDIKDSLTRAIEYIKYQSIWIRIIIHIPSRCKDLKKKVLDKLNMDSSIDPRLQVIIDHKDSVQFRINENERYMLEVKYTDTRVICSVCVFWTDMMKVTDSPIQNDIQAAHPEIYKEDIIARFKAKTPLGILKSFKNEEDLWRFIVNEQQIDTDTVKKRPGPKIHTNPETVHVSPIDIDLRDKLSPEEAAEHIGLTAGQKALDEILKSNL